MLLLMDPMRPTTLAEATVLTEVTAREAADGTHSTGITTFTNMDTANQDTINAQVDKSQKDFSSNDDSLLDDANGSVLGHSNISDTPPALDSASQFAQGYEYVFGLQQDLEKSLTCG